MSFRYSKMLSRGLMESLTGFSQCATTPVVSTESLDIDFLITIHQLITLLGSVYFMTDHSPVSCFGF